MLKYNRNYRLEVEGGDSQMHIFQYPLTLEFNIQRAALGSANNGTLRLYNLSPNTRKAIFKDQYEIEKNFRAVKLSVGYGDSLSLILNGHIMEAKSFREEGSTHFVTEIHCYDWSYSMVNATSDFTLGPPEYALPLKRSTIVERLRQDLTKAKGAPPLALGGLSDFDGKDPAPYNRPFVASGNTWDILKHETNDHCFIDNGILHCLADGDYIKGDVEIIDASTGLLSTPKKAQYMVKIDILMEPAIKIGQLIELNSSSETIYNGRYKVIGITHTGIISGAVNGKCRTSLCLMNDNLASSFIPTTTTSTPTQLEGVLG